VEVLSDILRSMRVTGSVYFCQSVKPPWLMNFSESKKACFHYVRKGDCWLTSGQNVTRLGPGDLLYVEAGRNHTLSSDEPGKSEQTARSSTLLLCGYCEFDTLAAHPLLENLPSLITVSAEELLRHGWLKTTLDQLSAEYMSQQPGSNVVVDKLTEILLVELIRINFGRSEQSGFIGALFDKQVSAALELMHADPQKSWTLDNLASSVAMSRAAFAKRFKDRVGQTMFEYLTALRMQHARELLRESNLGLYEIANRVGYDSDLAFAKAFKRQSGITPFKFRKQLRDN
jgi:AraC-like DNA-binding protein